MEITEDRTIFSGEKFRLRGKLDKDCEEYVKKAKQVHKEAGITWTRKTASEDWKKLMPIVYD